jgi:drug/metabolite transporter (DMT)-like permease
LLITLLSGPFLGEPAGPARLVAAAIGFSGVLIVLKPGGSGLISYGSIMGLVGVVCYAFTALLLRRLGHKQSSVNIAFWFTALTGIASGPEHSAR